MKRNTCRNIVVIGLGLIIAVAMIAAPSHALRVEGARISLDVEPGKTYTYPIGISINANDSETTLAIDVLGFGQMPADGTYKGLDASADTSPYTARPFITVDKPTVHLKPGERADVTATIAVPAGTKDGGRYAIILIHPATSASGAPAAFATAVAIPVFLTVKGGQLTEAGEITAIGPASVDPGQAFEVFATFKNTGNYHYYGAMINTTITDASGAVVATAVTKPFEKAIVPGQAVNFTNELAVGLPRGTYIIKAKVGQQDGTVFAEKTAALQVGSVATARPTPAPSPKTPGFGLPMAILGILAVFIGTLWQRKGGKP
ncbi:MAG: hypothetical protein A4E28_00964 [Methanocella sp. PtaU1.Bin125]|nr:MAG: hypothetical protein A4E28_00964 [Methanocella sp. PtaU1.Bin125]